MYGPVLVYSVTRSSIIAPSCGVFFFNDTATTEIYTLSLHDALPICRGVHHVELGPDTHAAELPRDRSEEHTSELQSPCNLVCRLLLEKKKKHGQAITQSKKKKNKEKTRKRMYQ